MISFSVMKSTFCLAYIEFIAILAASFVDNSRHLRAVQAILVRKVGFDATSVLKNNLEVDTRVEFVYTGFQTLAARSCCFFSCSFSGRTVRSIKLLLRAFFLISVPDPY